MPCPFLTERVLEEVSADVPRPYCTAAESFVQPLRADICRDRYELTHSTDCEIYHEHARTAPKEQQSETDS